MDECDENTFLVRLFSVIPRHNDLDNFAIPITDHHETIVDVHPVVTTPGAMQMRTPPIRHHMAIVHVVTVESLAACPLILRTGRVLQKDFSDNAGGDQRQEKLVVVIANPLIATRRLAQIAPLPVIDDIVFVVAILIRHALAATPTGIIMPIVIPIIIARILIFPARIILIPVVVPIRPIGAAGIVLPLIVALSLIITTSVSSK